MIWRGKLWIRRKPARKKKFWKLTEKSWEDEDFGKLIILQPFCILSYQIQEGKTVTPAANEKRKDVTFHISTSQLIFNLKQSSLSFGEFACCRGEIISETHQDNVTLTNYRLRQHDVG